MLPRFLVDMKPIDSKNKKDQKGKKGSPKPNYMDLSTSSLVPPFKAKLDAYRKAQKDLKKGKKDLKEDEKE